MGFDKGVKKALILFEDQMKEFSRFLGSYELVKGEKGTYCHFENYSKYSRVNATYRSVNKILSRTYTIDFALVIDNLDMDDDWEAKLVFTGVMKTKGIKLKHKSGDLVIIEHLNANKAFLETLKKYTEKVDVFNMTFKYSRNAQELWISITPYNGGYLWIKFPPIFYPMRFSVEEIYNLCLMFNLFGKVFAKGSWAKK